MSNFNCSALDTEELNCSYLKELASACGPTCECLTNLLNEHGCLIYSLDKAITLILIFVLALVGNILTIGVISKFKVHKVPDVLVIGLALTDLLATLIPVPMSIYAYLADHRYEAGTIACDLYGTLAQFTRYSSALIVTLISLERYFAINRPFIYRKYATPRKFVIILIICWLLALALAVAPALDPNTPIIPHGGICLFEFVTHYSYSIVVYTAVQYVIVFVCFVLVSIQLLKVYRRRKKLKVQEDYNRRSQDRARVREVKFNRPNLTSRISDLGKSIKKAAPVITEKFQLGVEAQFARMLFVVVVLFYVSWTTTVVIIIIALARQDGSNLEEEIFWGVRLTVISTALNPLVYGVLARQYRLAYAYVLRYWASYCCKCIDPPLKDVFAAARNGGQDQRGQQSRRESRYTNQQSHDGSFMSRSSEIPILTSAHIGIATFHEELGTIHEEDFMSSAIDSSVIAEHSTFVPSAGELASSVIIPMQARDGQTEESVIVDKKQRSASLHDIMDSETFLGPSIVPHQGVDNPLATIGMFSDFSGSDGDGTERASDVDMEEGRAGPTRSFNNPAYDLENRSRQQVIPPPMIAASSTDDIILLSKKNRGGVSPRHPMAQPADSQAKKKRKFEHSNGNVQTKARVRHSSSPPAILRKESFTAEGLVTNIDDFEDDSRLPSQKATINDERESRGNFLSNWKRKKPHQQVEQSRSHDLLSSSDRRKNAHQKVEQSRSHDLLSSATDRRGCQTLPHGHLIIYSTEDERGRRSTSLPPSAQTGVQDLRQQFESLSSSSPTPPVTPEDADVSHVTPSKHHMVTSSGMDTEAGTGIRMGRRNSNGNSDSGRESMIMESDSVQQHV